MILTIPDNQEILFKEKLLNSIRYEFKNNCPICDSICDWIVRFSYHQIQYEKLSPNFDNKSILRVKNNNCKSCKSYISIGYDNFTTQQALNMQLDTNIQPILNQMLPIIVVTSQNNLTTCYNNNKFYTKFKHNNQIFETKQDFQLSNINDFFKQTLKHFSSFKENLIFI